MNMAEADEGADCITFAAFASGKYAAMLPSLDSYTSIDTYTYWHVWLLPLVTI
jgi:hypothetical protein